MLTTNFELVDMTWICSKRLEVALTASGVALDLMIRVKVLEVATFEEVVAALVELDVVDVVSSLSELV